MSARLELPSELVRYIFQLSLPPIETLYQQERYHTLHTYQQLSKFWKQWAVDELNAHRYLTDVRRYLGNIAISDTSARKCISLDIGRTEEDNCEDARGPLVAACLVLSTALEVATLRQMNLQLTGAMGHDLVNLTLIDVQLSTPSLNLPHLHSLTLSRVHLMRRHAQYLLNPATLPRLRSLAVQFVTVMDSTLHYNDFELHAEVETIVPQLHLLSVAWSDLTVDNLHPQFGRIDTFIQKIVVDVHDSFEFVSCHSVRQAEFRKVRWFGREVADDLDDLTLLGIEIAQGEERFLQLETLILNEEWEGDVDLVGLRRVCENRGVAIQYERQPCDGSLVESPVQYRSRGQSSDVADVRMDVA